MPQIDFYSLKPTSRGDRFQVACRLAERIRAQDLRLLIHCPNRDEARHLDRLLWTYREDSFLPHGLVGKVDQELTPILIAEDGRPETEVQVLLNLGREVPGFFTRFDRVCDLVDLDPTLRAAGRDRFRYYRDQGHPLRHHQIQL